jgi:hypothetical protein
LELPLTPEMQSKIIGIDRFKMGAARTCNPDTMVKAILSGKAPIQVWFSVGGQQIVHMASPPVAGNPAPRRAVCQPEFGSWHRIASPKECDIGDIGDIKTKNILKMKIIIFYPFFLSL